MDIRIELFVSDLETSARFYEEALGVRLDRRDDDYASLRRGQAVLGLGAIANLPKDGPNLGFTQARVSRESAVLASRSCSKSKISTMRSRGSRRWRARGRADPDAALGLRDFRIVDPDGYYLRITTSS